MLSEKSKNLNSWCPNSFFQVKHNKIWITSLKARVSSLNLLMFNWKYERYPLIRKTIGHTGNNRSKVATRLYAETYSVTIFAGEDY